MSAATAPATAVAATSSTRGSAVSIRHFRCGGRLFGTTDSGRMSFSRGWREKRGGCIELRGRLLPVKDEEPDARDNGGESEGPDSEPEFLDADEIEEGAKQLKSWRVPSSRVKIQTADSHEYVVNGCFPLDDPWWTVSVKVTPHQFQSYAKEPPSYELDEDGLGEQSILSLFLNKCGVSDDHRKHFMDWLSNYPPVSFSTWKEKANNFGTANIPNILKQIENSESGAMAFLALEIPLVMKYLPKLLPSKIRSLLTLDVSDQESSHDTLYAIEYMLAVDPWKLGFGLIIYRELHICGCEATWESFRQCEDLLETIPALQTNALLIYREVKKKCMELGDTYVDLSELTNAVTKSQDMSVEAAWEALEFLKEYEIVVIEQKKVFLYSLYCYEVNIAEYIQKIVQRKTWNIDINENDIFGDDQSSNEMQEEPNNKSSSQCPTAALGCVIGDGSDEGIELLQPPECSSEPKCPKLLDADQKKAGKMILANPVTVISGKGGCGKTTVVSLVFKSMMQKESDEVEQACKALEEDIDASQEWFCDTMASSTKHNDSIRVLLTAPTGKAASLLKKKTGLPAATLHQVTCSYSAWKRLGNEQTEWKFSHVEALVVDEASLVSVRIFSAVLKLLYDHGRLAKLVILGDVRQLSSIEPGNMLADVFADLSRLNWAIELKTNHRAESQLIVDNATRISHQCCVEFDAFVHIDGHSSSKMPSEENKFILVSLADDVDLSTAISTLLKRGPGLQDDKHSQFITFRRNRKSRFEFRCDDKVCCTKNAYVKDLLSRRRNCREESNIAGSDGIVTVSHLQLEDTGLPLGTGEPEAKDDRLCNGEIFFVVNDVEKDKIRELTLSDGEDRTYTLNYKLLRSRSGLRHAWARTIHTFQGSEEDTVVYVLGNTGWQNWKHVYTAVTRGRKRVYIIARKTQLDKAITIKARDRKTSLKQRLKEKLPQFKTFGHPAAMSSVHPESSQATEEQEAEVLLTPHPLPYTQLKSPPRFSCPPVPTTPIAVSCTLGEGERLEHAGHIMRTPPDRIPDCELEESPPQKRTAGPVDETETPRKIRAKNNRTNWTEESPNSQRFQQLSLQSPCHKKLFNP
ncbi:DNA helicase B isoform X2 [Dendrobates tinctorius]|uniref:DNA helicase B isoform X2 n=1 Tax=Dendrobates tinctorius TaxID=92724 RepID=UPI003CCA31BC